MIAVYLSPIYAALCVYLGIRLFKWLFAAAPKIKNKIVTVCLWIVWGFLTLSPAIAFLSPAGTSFRRVMEYIGNYWLGIVLYAFLIVIAAELLRLMGKLALREKCPKGRMAHIITGVVCIILTAAVSIYGMVNAAVIRTTPYEITIEKDGGEIDDLNVVLLADLHMGYSIGVDRIEQMVEKVNAQNPDLIVIAGDIFDNDYEAMDDPEALIATLQKMEAKYGVYACYGNHDVAELILAGFTFGSDDDKTKVSDPKMDEFLTRANIQLLRDEAVLIEDSFYLYGRPDYGRPGRGVDVRKTPAEITAELNKTKPIIVIDHEPKELQELADAGVDADLCGHTHDGQVFPGNLIIQMFWENSCGYLQKDAMHNIVTSGVGLFGPNMRVGTIAEICPVTIHFQG